MKPLITTGILAALALSGTALWTTCRMRQACDERLACLETEIAFCERPAAPVVAVEERVIDLPEDGNQWHTILILRAGWQNLPAQRKAEAMFHSEPLLVSLKHQTHWHLITTDQAECAKFSALVDATPCLIVERANGQVVYRESGPDLGKRPHALTHAIRKEIQRHCPDGRCLPLHPVPGKDENPPQDEIPAVLRETPPPADKKASLVPLALVAGLAGLSGFALKFRKAAAV